MSALFSDHPQRAPLADELHARPHIRLDGPVHGFHLALLTDDASPAAERHRVRDLCRLMSAPGLALADHTRHIIVQLNTDDPLAQPVQMVWEGHAEFCTYTFFHQGPPEASFGTRPQAAKMFERLPLEWRAGLDGAVFDAVCFTLNTGQEPRPIGDGDETANTTTIVGGQVAGGNAQLRMDLQADHDGFSHVTIDNLGLTPGQAGRLIQRLMEISSYRMMALLGLPAAQKSDVHLRRIDQELATIAEALAPGGTETTDAQLHAELSTLNSEIERLRARNSYRFDASNAYYQLILRLLTSLREDRVEGLQTLSEFLDRRLSPAMRTCQATAARQDTLSRRANRMASLLRARIDVRVEAQNQELLASMDRRARTQLRLQETVEGLSVVAISYYLIGLVNYALKAMKDAGYAISPEIGTGIALPVVALLVWGGVRRIRKVLVDRHAD